MTQILYQKQCCLIIKGVLGAIAQKVHMDVSNMCLTIAFEIF